MKKITVTFSIPIETNQLLHTLIGRKKKSEFVSNVLQKALEEKANSLKKAYAEAESDPARNECIADWSLLDHENWK